MFKAEGTTNARVTSAAWCATGDKCADATCPNGDHEPMRLEGRQQPDFTGCVNFQQLFPKEKKNIKL